MYVPEAVGVAIITTSLGVRLISSILPGPGVPQGEGSRDDVSSTVQLGLYSVGGSCVVRSGGGGGVEFVGVVIAEVGVVSVT